MDLVPVGVSSPVACNDSSHELGWRGPDAGLRATGHDPTDEDVLHALGGERPPCVALAALWHDYRLEPLLLAAMLTGTPGLLRNQTFATAGPPVTWSRPFGLYRLVEPLLGLAPPLRRVLAAEAATAYSATDLLRTGAPDNTSAVRATVRSMLRLAAVQAFAVDDVDAQQVWVTDDADPPVLFVRARRAGELVLAGKVPVRWAALVALGVEIVEGRRLVLDVSPPRPPTDRTVRLTGYTLGRRDPELTPFVVDAPADDVAARIAAALAG